MTKAERLKLNPEYCKKILIYQKLDYRGRSKFFIMHKPNKWTRASYKEVPKYKRVRYTLEAAELVAFDLIKNYKTIFLT